MDLLELAEVEDVRSIIHSLKGAKRVCADTYVMWGRRVRKYSMKFKRHMAMSGMVKSSKTPNEAAQIRYAKKGAYHKGQADKYAKKRELAIYECRRARQRLHAMGGVLPDEGQMNDDSERQDQAAVGS